jgi:hypothetical protein
LTDAQIMEPIRAIMAEAPNRGPDLQRLNYFVLIMIGVGILAPSPIFSSRTTPRAWVSEYSHACAPTCSRTFKAFRSAFSKRSALAN